ncbi:MAG: hypothetical protein ABIQ16_19930 [Polyangiaceae bacterium]
MGRAGTKYLTLISLLVGYAAFAGCGGRALEAPAGTTESAGAPASAGATASAGAPAFAGATASAGGMNVSGATASGGSTDGWGTCDYNEDCTLLAHGCCGTFEPVDAAQLVAVNASFSADYNAAHCPGPAQSCKGSPPVSEYDETRKYFRAICVHSPTSGASNPGQCQVYDVRGTPDTSCITTSECTLREGVDCCPGCDGAGWVPINATVGFCSRATACGLCISLPPPGLKTSCQDGTCRFVLPTR